MDHKSHYKPLRSDISEIRIAILLPGQEPDPLVCKLHHFPLKEQILTYEALSYVWGNLQPPSSILIQLADETQFHTLSVTSNLAAALRTLRQETQSRYLWVDAICINQADVTERSAQVTIMRSIYATASRTVIFFGEQDQYTSTAVEILRRLGDVHIRLLPEPPMHRDPEAIENHLVRKIIKEFDDGPEAVAHFLSRPWWSRVWIVQEVSVAKRAEFYWGNETLRWDFCAYAILMIQNLLQHLGEPSLFEEDVWRKITQHFNWALALVNVFLKHLDGKPAKLLPLLEDFRTNEATDGRDKVFALLGLATDGHEESIVPNYEIDEGSVFGSVVKDVMIRSGNLDILAFCSGVGIRRKEGLPTWAPDWTAEGNKEELEPVSAFFPLHFIEQVIRPRFTTARPANSVFGASNPLLNQSTIPSPSDIRSVRFSADYKTLILKGIALDTISHLTPLRRYRYDEAELTKTWYSVATTKLVRNGIHVYPPTGELLVTAFTRTICADLFNAGVVIDGGFNPGLGGADMSELREGWKSVTCGRRFAITEGGRMGLVVGEPRAGDLVVIVRGARTPLVLTPADNGYFAMVGEAYSRFCSFLFF
jgi:hypothetical protein